MTRKHARRRPRQTSVPMLINRGLKSVDIETEEHMLVEAFANGYATTEHYDCLVDMRNVLTIAGNHKDDKSALAIINVAKVEVDYMKVTGATLSDSLVGGPQQLPAPGAGGTQTGVTQTGFKTTTQLPGATVTQHRMR